MPYYLVTQTQLVEADNPEAAAGKALDIITRADRLSFSVKSDETTTQVVVVSPPANNYPSSPGAGQHVSSLDSVVLRDIYASPPSRTETGVQKQA